MTDENGLSSQKPKAEIGFQSDVALQSDYRCEFKQNNFYRNPRRSQAGNRLPCDRRLPKFLGMVDKR